MTIDLAIQVCISSSLLDCLKYTPNCDVSVNYAVMVTGEVPVHKSTQLLSIPTTVDPP